MSKHVKPIAIPGDAGKHPGSNLEWWYCYAFLEGAGGRRYALMIAFFRVGELPVPKGHYLIYSLIRLDRPAHVSRSCLDRSLYAQLTGLYLPMYFALKPGDSHAWGQYGKLVQGKLPSPHGWLRSASVRKRPTRLRYDRAELAFADDARQEFALRIDDPEEGLVELRFTPAKRATIVDDEATLNGLYYYSSTRNRVTGAIRGSGDVEAVSGEGWFDHQWGRSYGLLKGEGWNWLGLQLDDGRELIVSEMHRPNGPGSPKAILIAHDRASSTVNVKLRPLRRWRSFRTGLTYPVEWAVAAPGLGLELHVAAVLDNQEMPIIGPLQAIWEGVCRVSGFDYGARSRVSGRGFVELAGYAAAKR
ncbi:lipocalin family protein [Paenibacillaceae bacterium WGS1546]|uniref:lipocalin family protein n=1 Tax=Cohnella sp. WGS1546 TaxID=3366810 RepID=UPI00372D39B2